MWFTGGPLYLPKPVPCQFDPGKYHSTLVGRVFCRKNSRGEELTLSLNMFRDHLWPSAWDTSRFGAFTAPSLTRAGKTSWDSSGHGPTAHSTRSTLYLLGGREFLSLLMLFVVCLKQFFVALSSGVNVIKA